MADAQDAVIIDAGNGPERMLPPNENRALRRMAMAVYVLQALSFAFGITAIAGIIVNYVKRDDVEGTWLQSHFDWQIRTFWWGLVWTVLGVLLIPVLIGMGILFVSSIWLVYRIVKGGLALFEDKPVRTRRVMLNVRL
ncbi:DUF4870 family protein [Amphibiibacter pelophylacis]|uniref:Uncharacterized protein n=1 Tax=Amphibiibacter pelophylacis TaxID=1799477 RepID=A0ACC6P129_9BURK